MAQTGFTPIALYYSSTASATPTAGNLVAGELALNNNDGRLFYKDSSNVVQVIGTKGGVGTSSTTQVLYNSSGLVVGSANMVFDGSTLTTLNSAYTGTLTGGTGIVNLGSGQFYKDASGNVGIGTSSPSSYNAQIVSYKATGNGTYLGHANGGGTFPKVSAIGLGSDAVSFTYTSNGSTFALTGSAQIAAIQTASAAAPTDLAFYTTTGGSVAERMRIASNGDVGIGANPASYSAGLTVLSANTFSTILAKCSATSGATGVFVQNDANTADCFMYAFNSASGSLNASIGTSKAQPLALFTNNTERMRINAGAPILCLSGGNTSATGTGIAFPATQSASSDANTLDDYEEGTWTPSQGSGLTVVGTFSSSGTYTKIGRQVTIIFQISGSTTIAAAGGGATICTNIPFTVAGNVPVGTVGDNQTATVGGVFYINIGSTNCFTNTALTAKSQYIFTATYFTS